MMRANLMNSSPQHLSPKEINPVETLASIAKALISLLALASYGLVLTVLIAGLELPGKPGWPEALLLLLAATATLSAMTRQLPLQNVLGAAAIIAVIGSASHGIGALTSIPFGPFTYSDEAGPRLFNTLAWPMPLLWVIMILNSRGVARLIMRPWRKLRAYGFWLIGITVVLTTLLDAALEPFAVLVKGYWFWHPTRLPLTWGSAPVTNFLGWALTSLLVLAFATPFLIDKRARPAHRPPDYHPLVAWLLALVLFGTGEAIRGFWIPAVFCAVTGIVVTIFALRGGRW